MTRAVAKRWPVLLLSAPSLLSAHEHHHHHHERHLHEHRHVNRHLQELLAQTPQGCGFSDPDVNEIYQLQAEQEERIVRVEEERIALERQQYEEQQDTNFLGCSVSMGGGGGGTGWDPGNGDDTGLGGGSGGGGNSGGGSGGGGNWNSQVTIPTYVHNVYSGSGEGLLSDATLKQSIQVANGLLASTGFQLSLKSIDRVQNDSWFQASSGSTQESEMQSQLKKGGLNTLNIYFKLAVSGSSRFCGYAYLAEDASAVGNGDGVTIDINCVLDRTTVAHEVGHWLNLMHTFAGGCSPGDLVDDTNAQKSFYGRKSGACPNPLPDTCPNQPGSDPLNNIMDYAPLGCDDIFTKGQIQRMQEAWSNIRNR